MKASHKDQKVSDSDDFLNDLRAGFSQENELTKTRGLDYSLPDKVIFIIFDFPKDIIVKAPDDLKEKLIILSWR